MKIVAGKGSSCQKVSELDRFFDIPPASADAFDLARKQLQGRTYPRQELGDILEHYNEGIGNDAFGLENIRRFKESDSLCVITGQQLGLLGGPAYTILKAISCLLVARQYGAVPIFWLATEDHDVDEVDHTFWLDARGNIEKLRLTLPHRGFIEDLALSDHQWSQIEAWLQRVEGQDFNPTVDKRSHYSKAMAALLAFLFRGTGLVFIEPYALRRLAVPFFKKEMEHADEIYQVLSKTTAAIQERGGKTPLEFEPGATTLFLKSEEGARQRIERSAQDFIVGGRLYTKAEFFALLESDPDRFSTGAASRPLLQSILFPTLAYVGGPAEYQYYRQLQEYHHFHQVPMPWVIQRLAAVFIPPFAAEWLETCQLHPWDPIPHHWSALFPEWEQEVGEVAAEWKKTAVDHCGEDLSEEAIAHLVKHSSKKIERRVLKKRLGTRHLPYYALHYLNNLLHPHGKPQDRVFCWLCFQSQTTEDLILTLLKQIDNPFQDTLYCFL